jgi:hypothetical protein
MSILFPLPSGWTGKARFGLFLVLCFLHENAMPYQTDQKRDKRRKPMTERISCGLFQKD